MKDKLNNSSNLQEMPTVLLAWLTNKLFTYYRAQVVVSQILPRSQNDKPGGKRLTFRTLMRINRTVTFVNDKLAKAAEETD